MIGSVCLSPWPRFKSTPGKRFIRRVRLPLGHAGAKPLTSGAAAAARALHGSINETALSAAPSSRCRARRRSSASMSLMDGVIALAGTPQLRRSATRSWAERRSFRFGGQRGGLSGMVVMDVRVNGAEFSSVFTCRKRSIARSPRRERGCRGDHLGDVRPKPCSAYRWRGFQHLALHPPAPTASASHPRCSRISRRGASATRNPPCETHAARIYLATSEPNRVHSLAAAIQRTISEDTSGRLAWDRLPAPPINEAAPEAECKPAPFAPLCPIRPAQRPNVFCGSFRVAGHHPVCERPHLWLAHDVRLMPRAYVRPYVKRGKTDAADAEAISTSE